MNNNYLKTNHEHFNKKQKKKEVCIYQHADVTAYGYDGQSYPSK